MDCLVPPNARTEADAETCAARRAAASATAPNTRAEAETETRAETRVTQCWPADCPHPACRAVRGPARVRCWFTGHGQSPRALPAIPLAAAGGRLQPRAIGLLLAGILLMTACATGPQRKTTFVGRHDGARDSADVALGLNPLASLDTCTPAQSPPPGARVLVSTPRFFSPAATDMLVALRDALVEGEQTQDVEMWLTQEQVLEPAAAQSEGLRCGAMLVLWEPHGSNTLELTLSNEALVPLRQQVRERLCPFGSRGQQVNTLYLTIVGLTAMLENRYDDAVYYLDTASRLDRSCLRLPGITPKASGSKDSPSSTDQAPAPLSPTGAAPNGA